mmetsp:Transcript_21308/g.24376  ORF Transcript_21308/g.24376 Transcript_21308/m.24376 type:complete len:83 (-) Transcript_21308:522-770(-)
MYTSYGYNNNNNSLNNNNNNTTHLDQIGSISNVTIDSLSSTSASASASASASLSSSMECSAFSHSLLLSTPMAWAPTTPDSS